MTNAGRFSFDLVRAQKPAMAFSGGSAAAWQSAAREKLAALLGMDKFSPCAPEVQMEYTRPFGGHTETRFSFLTETGWRAPCHLIIPKGAPKGVMICLQGHSTGMHISLGRSKYPEDENDIEDGDRDYAVQAADRGYIAAALDQRAFGVCGGTPRPDCYGAAMSALMCGRTLLGERVWDVGRLIAVLKSEFGYADLPYYCMGNSGGGTATVYAAAILPELAGAMPSCSVCTWEKSIAYTRHCACNYIPHIAENFDMGDIAGLIAPRPYVQVNGRDDDIFLLAGAEAAFRQAKRVYEAAGAPEKCRFVIGEAGHRFYAGPGWAAFEACLQ